MDHAEPTNQAERRRLLIEALLSERDERIYRELAIDGAPMHR